MNKPELAGAIVAASRLSGSFRLRSGVSSSVYRDKYRFESRPELLAAIASALQPMLPAAASRLAGFEGEFQPQDRAVVIEDVVTSGGQVCESIEEMRKLGLVVEDALCVIDREKGGEANLAKLGCTLRSVFRQQELESLAVAG